MKRTQSPGLSPQSIKYENPNDKLYNGREPSFVLEKPIDIKKTFSEIHSNHSHQSSGNSENLHTRISKIPKVILDQIASKTRQQNQNRFRDSFQQKKNRTHLSKRNNNQQQDLFDEAGEIQQQKMHPTGSIRKSLTSNKFTKINSMLSSRTATCPICMVEGNNKQFMSISGNECSHVYCRSCMHQYVIFKIKMFQKVTCPDQECNVSMKILSDIYAQLPLDTREKFKKITQYNEVLQTNTKRICPNQNCSGILDISNPMTNPRCPQCKIVYCQKCYFRNHAGECASHQLQFFSETLNYRQCTRCKNMIQKNDGCNHMTCRCGYQFCYLCGDKWKSSHNCQGLGDEPWVRDTWECCCFQCTQCEFCNSIDYCCECMCFDEWECCQIRPVRYVSKFLIIVAVFALGMPLWLAYVAISTLIRLAFGVFAGLVLIPCSAIFSEYNNRSLLVLGVIFLPITLPALIVFGIKMVFEDELEEIKDELWLPCEVVREFIQL